MHSEIVRRTGSVALRMATGRASFSMTISALARTRASRVATLVAAAFRFRDSDYMLAHKAIISLAGGSSMHSSIRMPFRNARV